MCAPVELYDDEPESEGMVEAGKGWLGHLVNFLGILAVVIAAVMWLQTSLHSIDTRLLVLESHVKDRWTRTDMKLWAQDFQLQNDRVDVPTVPKSHLYERQGG